MATLRIYGDVMDIQTKETLIAEIEQFKKEALKMHIVQVLANTYEHSSLFDCNIDVGGSVIWYKAQARQLWGFWQAAKAQKVPEGFVLVPIDQLNQWGHMANAAEQYGCCDCFESRGYAHNLACEINSYFEPAEAQEQSHDSESFK